MISARHLVIGMALALAASSAAHARGHGHGGGQPALRGSVRGGPMQLHAGRIHPSQRFDRREHVFAHSVGVFGRHDSRLHEASSVSTLGHSGGGIQCVTFARADSGIELTGNAGNWWANAAGLYQRGARPEAGAVLNFRPTGRMQLGHVAVVNQVVNAREIDIDHANWGGPGAIRGGISRDISVVDVSPRNDWSAVRVALGHSSQFGSVYPTFGFIYNRQDRGTMIAANDSTTPIPATNPAPRDLRTGAQTTVAQNTMSFDEVAEAPDSAEPVFAPHAHHHGRIVAHRIIRRHIAAAGYHTHHHHGRS